MKPKIWMYKDKVSGKPKGEATVTYDDPNAAQSAIQWFDGKDFRGSVIKVYIVLMFFFTPAHRCVSKQISDDYTTRGYIKSILKHLC